MTAAATAALSDSTPRCMGMDTRPVASWAAQATLECLNRTGVNVRNAEARELLARAGARGCH
jgi:trimethylamine:corrinoid methyltransferase-like protein